VPSGALKTLVDESIAAMNSVTAAAKTRTTMLICTLPANASLGVFSLHPKVDESDRGRATILTGAPPDIPRQRAMVKALTGNQNCVTTAEPAGEA
jgi:hypothetical protein